MWRKLAWDHDNFAELQRSYPENNETLGFAAINVCIAASSLRDWTVLELKRAARNARESFDDASFEEALFLNVPQQPMCEAIGNTAKHGQHQDRDWPGGAVSIDWNEPTEDVPGSYKLRYRHLDGLCTDMALDSFRSLELNWWLFLQLYSLVERGPRPVLEWRQRALNRMLGVREA
jgi:hypothetical protein